MEGKGTLCLFVGHQNECHEVDNVEGLKAELKKLEQQQTIRVPRQMGNLLMHMDAYKNPPKDGRKYWGYAKGPNNKMK